MKKSVKQNGPANAGPEPGGFKRTLEKILLGRPGLSKLWLAERANLTLEQLEEILNGRDGTFTDRVIEGISCNIESNS